MRVDTTRPFIFSYSSEARENIQEFKIKSFIVDYVKASDDDVDYALLLMIEASEVIELVTSHLYL